MRITEAMQYMHKTGNDIKDKYGNRFSLYHGGGIFIEYWNEDEITSVEIISEEEFLNGKYKNTYFFTFELK